MSQSPSSRAIAALQVALETPSHEKQRRLVKRMTRRADVVQVPRALLAKTSAAFDEMTARLVEVERRETARAARKQARRARTVIARPTVGSDGTIQYTYTSKGAT
jgi:hypothetical protein